MTNPTNPSPWLITGLLPRRTVVSIETPTGGGKTRLAVELTTALATGTPALRHFDVLRVEPVLFVHSEMDGYTMGKVFRAAREGWRLEGHSVLGTRDGGTTHNVVATFVPDRTFPGAETLRELARCGYPLLVLDGFETPSFADINNCYALTREFDCSVLMTRTSPRGDRSRPSTDTRITLTAPSATMAEAYPGAREMRVLHGGLDEPQPCLVDFGSAHGVVTWMVDCA